MWSFKIWRIKAYPVGPRWPKNMAALSYILFWTAFALLIVSLANPEMTTTQKVYLTKGSSTVIVLDESPSMAARDFGAESRFESAKAAIKRFVSSRENDELGLVTFSKESALRCPLTQDYNFFIDVMDNTHIMEMGDGTSIGMGLAMAALHLNQTNTAQKNIILITDGANNSGEIHPNTAIEMLVNLGIKTFVIGLGRAGVTKVNFTDPISGRVIDATIDDQSYDEPLLKRIAQATGGQFFRAETFATFESVFQALDAQEAGERRYKLSPSSKSYRENVLLIALGMLVLSFFVRAIILREAL